jgi:hypothetical protein
MCEWTIDRGGVLTRGTLRVRLLPSQIARLAALEKIDALERELAVHVGASALRANLGNEATAHDVALYALQEALHAWRRWTAEPDNLQDDAAILTDGTYAVRLLANDILDIVNAQVVADVGKVLERAASVGGRKGREDQRAAFERDDRPVSEQWREIQFVVTEFANAPPGADDDE